MVTEDLRRAVEALRRGEVVAYPTETFYGLGVDVFSRKGLGRLLDLKEREATQAISVLVVGTAMLDRLCAEVPALARRLIAAHWPGPLTLALPARPDLPAAVVAEGCAAVRESSHPLARALVEAFGGPLTATSANPAGARPPTTAAQVAAAFGARCLVLDGGETPGGSPSTLARVRGDRVDILRHGAVRL